MYSEGGQYCRADANICMRETPVHVNDKQFYHKHLEMAFVQYNMVTWHSQSWCEMYLCEHFSLPVD